MDTSRELESESELNWVTTVRETQHDTCETGRDVERQTSSGGRSADRTLESVQYD